MTAARFPVTLFAAAVIAVSSVVTVAPAPAAARTVDIALVVNNVPITNDDITKRRNLLRLMGTKGNLDSQAREDMIDQALKQSEIAFRNMSVTQTEVDDAFKNFASSNKMSVAQMGTILDKAGVGVEHFKFYIAVSMSWSRLLRARYGNQQLLSDDQFIAQLQEAEKEGKKPETTEYILKRIVFVVPEKERGSLLAKRKREAESARSKFPGCDQAIPFAASMNDVTVLDLGRFLEPQLPAQWKDAVVKAKGDTTSVITTPIGAEFLAICERKVADDDYAARLVLSTEENAGADDMEKESETYMKELKDKATIVTPGKS
ncbi:peptidylprolyl isomerase [Martelella endophytica]|uniref:Molecular chaperone SurA n=1 Tax=Martelella endophytica TaxID=1486262 RepID=A0A0D5LWQ6_MAREN|nr:peptidylprolyl isomerase [Martelella endophytica]AJY48237.1 hypothetical protein TM49_14680 [Martelella endophytica]